MTLIEHFVFLYNKCKNDERIKADEGTYEHFRIACKYLCGGNTTNGLNSSGVNDQDIKLGLENGIIKYEPRMGVSRKESGYTLTAKGVKKVFSSIEKENALDAAFWKANLIGEHVDIYSVINAYKALRDLTENEKDKAYEYISNRMGLMRCY